MLGVDRLIIAGHTRGFEIEDPRSQGADLQLDKISGKIGQGADIPFFLQDGTLK